MKVFMVIDALGKGGKERRMLELIKGLVQDNEYQIMLVSLTDIIEYDIVYKLPIEFEVIKRRSRKDPQVAFKLYRIIKEFNPDIIHSWGSMASIFLLPAIWLTKKIFLNGIIADAPKDMGIFDGLYFRTKMSNVFADRIISNSKAGIKSYKSPINKTTCIYNGIDINRFSNLPAVQTMKDIFFPEASKDKEMFIAGMVAAFEERKDYDTLIRAALTLVKQNEKINFLLVGNGADFSRIKALVPIDLQHRIVFAGKRSDVEAIINMFDVGILLTNSSIHGEGISNSILEYMALGKPVIATRGGGTDEAILDNETGYLIGNGRDDQLVNKIMLLMESGELRAGLGRRGRQLISEQFNLVNMTNQYIQVYKRLLIEKKKS